MVARLIEWLSMKTHGLSNSLTYKSWTKMRERCNYPKSNRYASHGARGIKVCKRWEKFENFYENMGERPSKDHSIDRVDNNGNYEPENCRWATQKEQANNRRSNRWVTIDGVTKTYTEWCEERGIKRNTVTSRLSYGWTIERALGI